MKNSGLLRFTLTFAVGFTAGNSDVVDGSFTNTHVLQNPGTYYLFSDSSDYPTCRSQNAINACMAPHRLTPLGNRHQVRHRPVLCPIHLGG